MLHPQYKQVAAERCALGQLRQLRSCARLSLPPGCSSALQQSLHLCLVGNNIQARLILCELTLELCVS